MKIRKLEIVGFKSFVDRTVLHFDHDVTGIVGPNGCGKSNVVDAIKWVMGEQSPSRLRGKGMEDVIFNGSESRGPHGFAEVAITFENADGLAPLEYRDYAEITVTRRLDRQGRSDYYINRTPVRLLDVTNLFLGTGVGRRAYSIIEQGRIGFIVSSKPEDRRSMIEEAAGITKFKVRRRAAERKMEQTRSNLQRVSDILGELDKSLSTLQRQAQKAERYKRYRDEVRDLELYVASFRYLELDGEKRSVQGALTSALAADEEARQAFDTREQELVAERELVAAQGAVVEAGQTKAFECDNVVRVLEGRIESLGERLSASHEREKRAERDLQEIDEQLTSQRAELDATSAAVQEREAVEHDAAKRLSVEVAELEKRRLAVTEAEVQLQAIRSLVADAEKSGTRAETTLQGVRRRRDDGQRREERLRLESDELVARATELEQLRDELAARLEGLRSGKEHSTARKAEAEGELAALRESLRELETELDVLRNELAGKRSRLRSLTELQQRFEGVGAGVRALMNKNWPGHAGLIGLVADRLDCPPELTAALAGALGPVLQHVVVRNLEDGATAVQFLRDSGKGRATLVAQVAARTRKAASPAPVVGQVGRLSDLVQCASEDMEFVRALLDDTIVVETLEQALAAAKQGRTENFVTLAGERVGCEGTLTGGQGEEGGAHLLELKREMRELTEVVDTLEQRLEVVNARHGELRTAIAGLAAEVDTARSAGHETEIAIVTAEKDLRRVEEDLVRGSKRRGTVEDELAALVAQGAEATDEAAQCEHELRSAQAAFDAAMLELADAEAIFGELRRTVEQQATRVTEVQVGAAQAKERAEADRVSLLRLERSLKDLQERSTRLSQEILAGGDEQTRSALELAQAREELTMGTAEAMAAHEALGQARATYEAARQSLSANETSLRTLRLQIDEVAGRATQLTLRDRELAMAASHLMEQIEGRHRVDLRTVLIDYHSRELPSKEIRERVQELDRLIERMGAINLTAIEEYDEKAQRFEFLTAQKADLEEALKKLDRAIREMNKESRRLFRDAFVEINERFKRIFPELFRGGKAELSLTDPNDMLESGIDIVAQPPGKKLGSLELMSGGEKALTAVALIFAIFQYKPSPFCLLDEVDAPLDEANISRFAQAIRQMTERSQFIVITHSKRTMEYTDVLYGVTMEEPGISKVVSVELRGEHRPVPGAERSVA